MGKAAGKSTRQSHAHRTLELSGDKLRIVAVADTHSRPHPMAASRIAALEPDAIVHAGDIGDLSVIDDLAEIAPVIAVRGNIDESTEGLPDVVTIDVGDARGAFFRILMTHIAVYGPKIRAEVAKMARAENADLIVCGHSHVPFAARDRGLTVFNPGSIGPKRFQLPIVFGVIDISRERVDVRHIDCVSGERWSPGASRQETA
ncbi:MAG: metallophosphoesterase family protein [Polyangiaceae bacterium]|nr:metallophosphoesterase family protein [Polyangiaceae bacterium]